MRLPLALVGLLITTATAYADMEPARPEAPAPRIGVVIELAVNVEPDRADAIGAALADALNRELEVDAFGGADVARTLPEDGLPDECLAHRECVDDVARRLDAEQLLFLAIVQVGSDVQVDSSWVDLSTGAVSARPRVVLGSDARAVSVFADAATRLLPDARKRQPETIVVGGGDGGGVVIVPGPSRHMTTPAWITTGVTGAALIAGGILAATARSTYARCDKLAGGCSDGELDGLAHRALAADVSFVVALGAAVTTVVLYVRSDAGGPSAHEHAGLRIAPTGRGAVVGFGGTF